MRFLLLLLIVCLSLSACDKTVSHQTTGPKDRQVLVRNGAEQPETLDPQKIKDRQVLVRNGADPSATSIMKPLIHKRFSCTGNVGSAMARL